MTNAPGAPSTTLNLPVLPLDDAVVLPGMVVPLQLADDEVRAAVEAAQSAHEQGSAAHTPGRKPRVLLVPRVDGAYRSLGVIASVEQVGRLSDGETAALVRAGRRVRIGAGTTGPGRALWVEATLVPEPGVVDESTGELPGQTAELVRDYKALTTTWLQKRGAWQVVDRVQQIEDVSELADNAGYASYLTSEQRIRLLETLDPVERLKLATGWLRDHLAEQEVAESIRKDVQEGMDKQQREFLLKQQLAAVRKELHDLNGDPDSEEEDYRARVEAADLPDNVREAALKEVEKLERASDASPEGGWIRTWLDTVLEMPWTVRDEDGYDIPGARAVLDADHNGLEDVKDRIVEYLAVRKRRADRGLGTVGGRRSGAVLALVGPPGVGKTSLGESVARAMGRKFTRVALGGVRDEAEIRGHRRTYVGALPGRIVRAIGEAGSMNPVVLLDEIDKVGSDYRGDPSSALLEVLDPAQNHTFRDHYLEVELDLSDVVFLATANVLENIPQPLLDRMELVQLDGYTEDEKVAIARDHLLPRQLELTGMTRDEVTLTDEALRKLAAEYTREAGVRTLERSIGRVLRKVAARTATGAADTAASGPAGATGSATATAAGTATGAGGTPDDAADADAPAAPAADGTAGTRQAAGPNGAARTTIGVDDLRELLGRPRFVPESAQDPEERRTSVPGVATGLAVTGAGGDVLFVEASLSEPGTGSQGLTLTGQLGDVMKESAQIALSYVRSHGRELRISTEQLADRAVHLHVPAGAVPKDGPSAGVTMTTALVSLLTGRKVRPEVAMTGEVSLTGRVLPIGGVKQKLLAAQRAGITTVLIPQRNEADLDDVPEHVLEGLTVHPVADVQEVLALALGESAPSPRAATEDGRVLAA